MFLTAVVGASAGGQEALQAFLRDLPHSEHLAVIVALCDSIHGSQVPADLLASWAAMPIVSIEDGVQLEPGHVFVVSVSSTVSLEGHRFRVEDRTKPSASPIDDVFRMVAEQRESSAIGIILSGGGTDGTVGLEAISQAGGLVVAQQPTTAQFVSMPSHAIATGIVDHVLPPEQIGPELIEYVAHMIELERYGREDTIDHQIEAAIPSMAERLRATTDHDFAHYKVSTLVRRFKRRMQVVRIGDVSEYLDLVQRSDEEAAALFREFLIGVTRFFRDPEAFESLRDLVLAKILREYKPGEQVRIWVPGCATGEEAYSLAMLVREELDHLDDPPIVQIFATDLDDRALAQARKGAYGERILDQVEPHRLQRFFVKRGQRYHATKELRELCLFSLHDLIGDPPFSQLDLISCRNVLIYLGPHLQKKLFSLFHYALRSGGYLFLGPSETTSAHRELFRPVDAKHRISQRKPIANRPMGLFPAAERLGARTNHPLPPSEPDMAELLRRIVLDEFSPRALVVDEEGQILASSGNMDVFLGVTGGAFANNLIRLAREGLRVPLRTSMAEAIRTRRRTEREAYLSGSEGHTRIRLTVQPMPQLGQDQSLYMVVFKDEGEVSRRGWQGDAADSLQVIDQLEQELTTTRLDLEKSIQDLEAANEELKSSNEELLSMNEELQSANEELETSKEEIQTTNEALSLAHDDLENLLRSTEIGVIFLDEAQHIRKFTPAAARIYNILASDTGRPLAHLTHRAIDMPPLPGLASLLQSVGPLENRLHTEDGRAYLRRVLPYRDSHGKVRGIVITFTDVSTLEAVEHQLEERERRYQAAVEAAEVGTWWVDLETMLDTRDGSLNRLLGLPPEPSTLPVDEFLDRIHPDDRAHADEAFRSALQRRGDYVLEHRIIRPDGTVRWVRDRGRVLTDSHDAPVAMTGALLDITEHKNAELAMRESERSFRTLIEHASDAVMVADPQGALIEVNQAACDLLGRRRDRLLKTLFADLIEPSLRDRFEDLQHTLRQSPEHQDLSQWVFCVDDNRRHVEISSKILPDGRWLAFVRDLTARRLRDERRRRQDELRRVALSAANLGTWELDVAEARLVWDERAQALHGIQGKIEIPLAEAIAVIHGDDRDIVDTRLHEVMQGRGDGTYDVQYRTSGRGGTPRWLRSLGHVLFDIEGRQRLPTRVVGVCLDISEQKRTEHAIREASAHKDQFMAMLGHELRNPLAAISSAVEVQRMIEIQDLDLLRTRDVIVRQTAHMRRLLDDLLDVARIARGKIEVRPQKIDLIDLVQQVIDDARGRMKQDGLELQTQVRCDSLPVVVDPSRLAQAIENLLDNARKFTESPGGIRVLVERHDGEARVVVEDDGIGMEAEDLHSVFEAFRQGSRMPPRSEGGLGLGLALVHSIATLHGGRIEASSDGPGRGSRFSLHLPVHE